MGRYPLLIAFLSFLTFSLESVAQIEEEFFGELNTVVIDAGHGGKDKGCLGSKSYEKDVALAISLKLGAYLEEKFDHLNVIYTRKTDVFLELDERAKVANRNKADLFICIHANAASSSAFGTETFVMGNAKTEANMKAAKRENAAILLEDNYEERYENFNPNSPESYIAMTIMQGAFQNQSIMFAELVQKQFRERVGRKDRGVKMAPFLVLHQTTMPSVLIETGFLTNKAEEEFLRSEIGQDYLASAIYRAFKDYKNELETTSKQLIEQDTELEVVEEKDKKSLNKGKVNSNPNELIFKVQLTTTSEQIEINEENFRGLNNVEFYQAGGLFRYTYGNEKTLKAANEVQDEAKANGFEDAFIIAFYNGKRIAVGEAVKLLKDIN